MLRFPLAGLFLFLCIAPLRADVVSVETYRTAVSGCLGAIDGPTPVAEAPCRRLIEASGAVFPDGQTVTVDNRALARDLNAAPRSPEARAAAKDRLKTLSTFLGTALKASAGDPRAQAQAILQRDEFRDASAPPPPKSWWDRLWERVGRAIERFFSRLFRNTPDMNPGGGRILGQSLLYLLAGLAIAAAVVAAVSLYNNRAERRRRAKSSNLLADLEEGAGSDPLAAARTHANSGDYRSALRLTYLACLRRLFDAGLLVPQDDHTNWEYQRALRGRSPEAYDTLLAVTRDFDRIWYGEMPATQAEYERALAAHSALPEPNPGAAAAGGKSLTGGDRR